MKLYQVATSRDGHFRGYYVPTLNEAYEVLESEDDLEWGVIARVIIVAPSKRQTACNILNRQQFVHSREIIYSVGDTHGVLEHERKNFN